VTSAAGIFEELLPEHLHYLMMRGIAAALGRELIEPSFWNMPAGFH